MGKSGGKIKGTQTIVFCCIKHFVFGFGWIEMLVNMENTHTHTCTCVYVQKEKCIM